MPAASEAATAVETPEAAGVGETYTTVEAARYAMAETATPLKWATPMLWKPMP